MLNQSLTGLQQGNVGAARPQIENPLGTVATSLNMAIELSQRVERIVERLIGPTGHEIRDAYPATEGVLYQVQAHAEEAKNAIRMAHETLERLEGQI